MSVSLDLVVDTSRKGMALGLFSESSDFLPRVLYEPTARGEMLSQKLDHLLLQAQASLSQVKRVMVALGPGTFTGLRTGIAFCEGLCVTSNRTLHGVSTLRALATRLPQHSDSYAWPAQTVVVYKARPGYWYVGCVEGEFFLDTVQAKERLGRGVYCVADEFAWAEPQFQSLNREGWLLDDPAQLSSFCTLWSVVAPQKILTANYIQDSYFEKKG